jgi:hypothetical protein
VDDLHPVHWLEKHHKLISTSAKKFVKGMAIRHPNYLKNDCNFCKVTGCFHTQLCFCSNHRTAPPRPSSLSSDSLSFFRQSSGSPRPFRISQGNCTLPCFRIHILLPSPVVEMDHKDAADVVPMPLLSGQWEATSADRDPCYHPLRQQTDTACYLKAHVHFPPPSHHSSNSDIFALKDTSGPTSLICRRHMGAS